MKSKYLFGTVLIFIAALAEAKIFHVSQDGGVDGLHEVFPTIGSAAALAQPGDTILVHGGTYRERIAPPRGGEEGRPITYMAVPGEDVIVKGSDVWKPEWVKAV